MEKAKVLGLASFLVVGILAVIIQNGRSRSKPVAAEQKKVLPAEARENLSGNRRVTILYATTTGTSKKFANTFYHHLQKKCNMDLQLVDLKDYSEDNLKNEDIVIIITSTYEGGQAPQNAKLFFDDLNDQAFDFRVSKDTLSKVQFAVFGLGGAIYGGNYAKAVSRHSISQRFVTLFMQAVDADSNLERLGAIRLEQIGLGDDSSDLEQSFYKWSSRIVKLLQAISPKVQTKSTFVASKTVSTTNSQSNCNQPKGNCCQTTSSAVDEVVEEDEEDRINNAFIEYEESKNGAVMDLEEVGPAIARMKQESQVAAETKREMVTKLQRKALTKEGYKIIGSHSAVKLCRWTKNQLRGRGGCYKHSFYGITSYQCMEATPSLACANKCVFCWRHHKNPVGTEWRWKEDEPSQIVEEAVKYHVGMIHELKGLPGVQLERLQEAHTVKHCALSLVGEPIMYPRINEMLFELHKREISSFLVTNAQFPDRIDQLDPVTQLYVSVDAATKDSLKAIDRPLFKDYWERFLGSLASLKKKLQRTVYRLTLVKSWNMSEVENYAQLIEAGMPGKDSNFMFVWLFTFFLDFIEIKAVTYCGKSDASSLTMENVPWHKEVCSYAEEICRQLELRGICSTKYSIATEHEHSCCVLIAREDKFKVNGEWYTWIDYPKFQQLIQEYYASNKTKLFKSEDYRAKTPSWAVYQSTERGFDPAEQRWKRNKTTGEVEAIEYQATESGCG
jgi:tRNA wybutosine-synthesizing protein 1